MRFSRRIFPIAFSVMMITLCPRATHAVDTWEAAASELARKIVAHAPPRARMTLDVQNRSSLTEDEVTSIARAIRTALREQGARLAATGRPQAQVVVTISENLQSLVWVAQIVPTESAPEESSRDVEMVEVARSQTASPPASSPTMVIHQELLFEQSEPILDLVMLQSVDDSAPRMLLLDKNDVVLYAKEGGVWTVAQSAPLARSRPWPRDPRGRLVAQPDGGFTVFTPMVTINEYWDLAMSIIIAVGVVFELPVLILLLSVFGIVTPKFLWKNFRYAVLITAIIAAAIVPTNDMASIFVVWIPLVALYLLSIGLSWIVYLKKRKKRAQAES